MSHSFCRRIGPSSRPSSGQKIVRPVRVLPIAIGQLIEEGPAVLGQQRGVVLDRAVGRQVDDRLRHEQRDVGHEAEVGLERVHELERFGRLPRFGLLHGQALLGRRTPRAGPWPCPPCRGRRTRQRRSSPRAQQLLEDGLAEGFLAVDDDAHGFPSRSECRTLRVSAGRGDPRTGSRWREEADYSAAIFLTGSVAPTAFRFWISSAE